jgi:opacity protein-like surface antigen
VPTQLFIGNFHMRLIWPLRIVPPALPAFLFVIAMAGALPGRAFGADLLGLYGGGSVGRSQVEAHAPSVGEFKENHSAFKVMVGLRPISLLGAELAYIDFGHPTGNINATPADAYIKGAAAFGLLHLPVPVVDVFVKAGLARLQSSVNTTNVKIGVGSCTIADPNCALFRLDRTNTSFAGGAGAQVKFGSLAVRAEYERFNAAGGNPSLFSLGLTWTFL